MVRIREVVSADLPRVLDLNEASVPEVTSLTIDALVALVEMSSVALVVEAPHAGADEVIAGFCLVLLPGQAYESVNYRWFMERFSDAAYLDRVVIDGAARGLGLGSALYREVERRLVSGWPTISRLGLEVNLSPPNPASLEFHRRLGFIEAGRQVTPYGAEVSLLDKPLGLRSSGVEA